MTTKYSDNDFEALLEQYDYKFKKGDIVKGVVCGYEADGAIRCICTTLRSFFR